MNLQEFNKRPEKTIQGLNKLLSEQFGISIKPGTASLDKLTKINKQSNVALVKIRGSGKKFHLEPEYAKYLGLRDLTETMIMEGYYPESEGYKALESKIYERVKKLMDMGYTTQEACDQCMNEVRLDASHCYEDSVTKPMVMSAVKAYEASCGMSEATELPETDLNPSLLSELAKEVGVELESLDNYEAIEEKLNGFAEITGKSRDAVVGFLNGLEEDALVRGIQMFGRKIAEKKLNDSIQYMYKLKKDGKSVEEIAKELDMKPEEVKDAMSKTEESVEESKVSMFDDIIDEMISEDVDVEQAEVIMAVRALADDIQDHVERVGRMVNEDLPAIADQMRSEMGADVAQGFADSMSGLLNGHLEAVKQVKQGMDQGIDSVTGGGSAMGLGDLEQPPMDDDGDDIENDVLGLDDEEPVDNVPAAAGPEEEPLGRAEI